VCTGEWCCLLLHVTGFVFVLSVSRVQNAVVEMQKGAALFVDLECKCIEVSDGYIF
jgi:hypothetical protein